MDKVSYALGLGIGRQLCDMGARELNIDDFAQAIKDVIADAKKQVSDSEAQTLVQNFFAEQEKKQSYKKTKISSNSGNSSKGNAGVQAIKAKKKKNQ